MNAVKFLIFSTLSLSCSICFGVISEQIDLNPYLSHNGKYLNGSGGPPIYITDTEDVYEFYTKDFRIKSNIRNITYDVTYTADKIIDDPTHDLLAFRIFPSDSWVTHWGRLDQDVAATDFTTGEDKSETVKVDLLPFQDDNVAMGWAFLSDIPSTAHLLVSDIRIEVVDTPGTFALLGAGLLATLPLMRKRKSKSSGTTVNPE